jgi:hypothetical protein
LAHLLRYLELPIWYLELHICTCSLTHGLISCPWQHYIFFVIYNIYNNYIINVKSDEIKILKIWITTCHWEWRVYTFHFFLVHLAFHLEALLLDASGKTRLSLVSFSLFFLNWQRRFCNAPLTVTMRHCQRHTAIYIFKILSSLLLLLLI